MLNRVGGGGGGASLTQVHRMAWAVTGSSGVNGSRASSLYSCTTTKFVQMEYQVTAAGQLSLIKWNNRSHKFFLHSGVNGKKKHYFLQCLFIVCL